MANQEVQVLIKLAGADRFKRDIGSALSSVNNQATGTSRVLGGLGNAAGTAFRLIGTAAIAAGAATVGAFAAITKTGVQTAATLETSRQGFITLLGSAKKADAVLEQIKKDAAQTPFELVGLIQANQMLTAVTKDGQRSERMLLNVGRALAAMGKGQPELDRIIVNLQQIGAVGKASMLDIKQFAFAGIPIFDMLQTELGVTGEALGDMISDGEVSFEILEEMFQKAGEGSGRFAKAFTNQSGTFAQLTSNMKDAWNIFTADFVTKLGSFDKAKNLVKGLTGSIQKLGLLVDVLSGKSVTMDMVEAFGGDTRILNGVMAFRENLKKISALFTALRTGSVSMSMVDIFGGDTDMLNRMLEIRNVFISLKDKAIDFGTAIYNFFQSVGQTVGSLINSPAFKRNLEETRARWEVFLSGLREGWQFIVQIYNSDLKPALEELWRTLGDVFNQTKLTSKGFDSVGIVIGVIVAGVLQLIAVLIRIFNWFAKVSLKARDFKESVRDTFNEAKKSVESFMNHPAVKLLVGLWRFASNPGGLLISTIKGDGKANGGIVGGSSYSGDKILTPINSGEMVINRTQQSALFNFLKNMSNQPRVNINSLNMSSGMASPMQQKNDLVQMLGLI